MGELPLRRAIPSFCAGKSLSLAALGQAAPSSAGSDYSRELESVLRWRPPPQSCLRLQTSPPLCYLPVWGCVGWGAPLPPAGRAPARPPAGPPLPFFLCQAHSGHSWALALLPGIVREASNTSKSTRGRGGSSPSPLTWNPDDPGFYVCGAFGKQNA